jgi:hypothetical protein
MVARPSLVRLRAGGPPLSYGVAIAVFNRSTPGQVFTRRKSGRTGILLAFAPDFSFFHRIQRAKPSAFGHVGCAQLSSSFRAGNDDEILCSAERSGRPLSRFAR